MTLSVLLALISFSFVSSITPGPNNIMLFSSGVNFGVWRTIPHAFGIMVGFASLLFAVGLGLGLIFKNYPLGLLVIKVLGGGYMLYLAWRIAFSKPMADAQDQARPMSFFAAALFQWVNPKAWVMASVAMSTYASTVSLSQGHTGTAVHLGSGSPLSNILIVVVVFGLVNLPSVSIWAICGQFLRVFLQNPRKLKLFNFTMAAMLVLSLWPMLN